MNEQELRFIIKMTDQASATLKQIKDAATAAGGGAEKLGSGAKAADVSLGQVVKTAKEAAGAVASFWASSKIASASTHAYGELEEDLRKVAQTTKLSEGGMADYRAALSKLSQEMQNIPTEKLTHFSEVAGLLGGRSVSEITKFSETMAKLDRIDDIGAEGPTQIGRLLTNLHEGLDTVPKFAAVFHTLKTDTKASAQEILNMASVLTQATSRMNMTSTAVTAMAAGLAQMDMDPGLAANSIGKAFGQIYDAALQGSQGMDELTKSLGMNRMEFLKLLEEHPEQAMYNFLGVIRKLQQEGKSPTPLLTLFNLQDLEAQRTLGTAAKSLPKLLQKDRLGQEAKTKADKGGPSSLDAEFDKAKTQVNDSLAAMSNSFSQLKMVIGSGLAPVIVPPIKMVTAAINVLTNALTALPAPMQSIASAAAVAATGLVGLRSAFSAVSAVAGLFGVKFAGLGSILRVVGSGIGRLITWTVTLISWLSRASGIVTILRVAFTAVGAVISGALSAPVVIVAAIVAAITAAGVAIYTYWDELKAFFSQSWDGMFNGLKDALVNVFTGAIDKMKGLWHDFVEWLTTWTSSPAEQKAKHEQETDAHAGHSAHGAETAPYLKEAHTAALSRLTAQQKQTIGGLLPLFQQAQELQTQFITIQALEENLRRDAEKAGGTLTAEEEHLIASAKAMLALKKAQLDPTYEAVRAAQDQQAQAEAVTKEMQNQLAVTQALRSAREKAGTLSTDDEAKIRTSLQKAQAAERAKAFADQMRGLEDELNAAVAVTKADKDRLEVNNLIRDAIREQGYTEDQLAQLKSVKIKTQQAQIQATYVEEIRGIREATALTSALTQQERERLEIAFKLAELKREKGYNDRQLADIKGALEAQKQAEAFASLRQELDPVGQATRDYTYKIGVLQKAMADGVITGEQYGQMLRALQLKTFDQRDPFAAQVLSLQQQIALEKVQGQYKEADKSTMQTVLQLQRQGVELNDTQIKQLAELNRQLEDTKKEQSSGLTGWMNGVGTLKDNLMDLTKDFGSGLAGAISGALQGKKGSFSQFLSQLGGKMIDLSVNQLMKTAMQETGLGSGIDGMMKQLGGTEQAKPFDTGLMKNMQTQMMTVAAGSVVVNGGASGLPGGLPGVTPSASNDNTAQQAAQAAASVDTTATTTAATAAAVAAAKAANSSVTSNVVEAALKKQATAAPMSTAALPAENQASLDALLKGGVPADAYNKSIPASIRTNNPGAMWYAPWEKKYGALGGQSLNDGLGQNNNAAMFPTMEAGGAAQFELLKRYGDRGWDMRKAIKEWSGGNSSEQYAQSVAKKMGTTPDATLASQLTNQDSAIRVAKSMAQQEAGRQYPMSDAQWQKAWQLYQYKNGAAAPGVDPQTTGSIPKVDQAQLDAARQAQGQVANDNQVQQQAEQARQAQQAQEQQLEMQRQQEEQLRQAQLAQQQYSQSLTQTNQTMTQATPQLGGLGQGITGLLSPLANAIPGLGKFGKGIMGLASQLLGSLGGGGGGGGGGLFGSLFGGLFHGGGEPGVTAPPAGVKAVSMAAWASAPRFHTGLKNDEYPAILQRNERVLTRAQNTTTKAQMNAMADTIDRMGSAIANTNSRGGNTKNMTVVNNIQTPNADSFRRSDGQRAADTAVLMQRMGSRNN